jgi:hypothetical protein
VLIVLIVTIYMCEKERERERGRRIINRVVIAIVVIATKCVEP